MRSRPVQGTVSSFHVKGETSLKCVFCSGDHFPAECTVVTDVKEREDCLQKSGRCFLCLSTKHLTMDCDRRRNCRKCGGSDHRPICDAGKTASEEQNGSLTESQDVKTITTTTTQAKIKTNVLQQTARTVAYVKSTMN